MSSPPQTGPPPFPDENRGPYLNAMFWTWSAIAILLTTLRFYIRIRIRTVGWDDWMMLLSVVLLVLTSCFISYMASIGGSRHVAYLSPEQVLEALKWSWIVQPPTILLFGTAKASIGILQLRIISKQASWSRAIIYATVATAMIVNILTIVFTFAQCSPPKALWTPSLKHKCWDPAVQEHVDYFFAACNIAADVVFAVIPSTFIPGLSLSLKRKIALCVLLGFGILAAVFGIIKTVYLSSLTKRADFTWAAFDIQAWSGAEAFVLIFCGNLPPLQPLWQRIVKKRSLDSYGPRDARKNYIASDRHQLVQTSQMRSNAIAKSNTSFSERSDSSRNIHTKTDITITREDYV